MNFVFWFFLEISTLAHKNARINIFMVSFCSLWGRQIVSLHDFRLFTVCFGRMPLFCYRRKKITQTYLSEFRLSVFAYLMAPVSRALWLLIKPFLCPKGEFCPLATKTSSVCLVNLLGARDFCVQIGPDFNLKSLEQLPEMLISAANEFPLNAVCGSQLVKTHIDRIRPMLFSPSIWKSAAFLFQWLTNWLA